MPRREPSVKVGLRPPVLAMLGHCVSCAWLRAGRFANLDCRAARRRWGLRPERLHVAAQLRAERESNPMLRIYADAIEVIRLLNPVLEQVKLKNAGLAEQCDRAATSVALNLSEGAGQRAGNRRQRYLTALGEAREVWGACDIIEAKRLAEVSPEIRSRLNKIIGTLVNITK